MEEKKRHDAPSKRRLALLALSRFVPGFLAIAAILFLPAGSLAWPNGWIFIGSLGGLMALVLAYMIVRDPALIEKRLRFRERRKAQKRCIAASFFVIIPFFALPGLDWRFSWSRVPLAFVVIGLALVLVGYALFFAVMRANSYASRVIEVQEGQKLIDTGPYALMRHPMYSANALIYLASPLVLGSWWALIPAVAILPFLVLRIRDEEAMLARELPGYAEYRERVRWRMLPGIW
jgi:protein-S-isoprenylcysteine O-methyltransferase Ste14